MECSIVKEFKNSCIGGDLETVQKLFDNVKNIGDITHFYEMRNLAVKHGHLDILKFFYEKGIDVNELFENKNPLLIAARKGLG